MAELVGDRTLKYPEMMNYSEAGPQLNELMNMALMPGKIFQNRIAMENAMAEKGINEGKLNYLFPGMSRQQQWQQAGQLEAQQQQQATQQKELQAAGTTLKTLRSVLGTQGIRQNWDQIKNLHPLFGKLSAEQITDEGVIINHPQTGQPVGMMVDKGDGKMQFVKLDQGPPKMTAEQLGYKIAKEKLEKQGITDREPTGEEIAAGVGSAAALKQPASKFSEMDEAEKALYYEEFSLTRKAPPFAYRDINARNDFIAGYAKYVLDKGATATDVEFLRSQKSSLAASYTQQTKNQGMMGSYIKNINKQVDRVKEIMDEIAQMETTTGVRILNVPFRSWAQKFKGSPLYTKLNMYSTEISNEVTRLSSGNAQSIAQLPEGAREHWEKIHDQNLPLPDLKQIYDESAHAANLRYESVQEQLDATQKVMRTLKLGGADSKTTGKTSKEDYAPLVTGAAKQYGVPEELVNAVIDAESSWNPKAVSKKGARGLMQLMPETQKKYGVKDPHDPAQNINAGVQLLADLMKQYNGDIDKVLAAYNAGNRYPNETIKYTEKVKKGMQPAAPPAPAAPKKSLPAGKSKADWIKAAKEKNPGMTDEQLEAKFKEIYG